MLAKKEGADFVYLSVEGVFVNDRQYQAQACWDYSCRPDQREQTEAVLLWTAYQEKSAACATPEMWPGFILQCWLAQVKTMPTHILN